MSDNIDVKWLLAGIVVGFLIFVIIRSNQLGISPVEYIKQMSQGKLEVKK